MKYENLVLGVFAVLILGICAYLVVGIGSAVAEIAGASIGVGGVIIGSVMRHSMELTKQREQERLIAENRQKHELFLIKQANYQKLMEKIGLFAAGAENGKHELTVAHVESWVYGDSDVVSRTSKFLKDPSQEALENLLATMRRVSNLLPLEVNKSMLAQLYPEAKTGLKEQ